MVSVPDPNGMLNETEGEGSGTVLLEVKFRDQYKTSKCESSNAHYVSVNQERKLGDRRWLDTTVVPTVNYFDRGLGDDTFLQILPESKGNRKSLGFGGSIVARLKLKRIDGRTHQEWSLRLNSTQHEKTHQDRIASGIDRLKSFHDFLNGGAWPFLVRGLICLVNSDNVRDLNILITRLCGDAMFLRKPSKGGNLQLLNGNNETLYLLVRGSLRQ